MEKTYKIPLDKYEIEDIRKINSEISKRKLASKKWIQTLKKANLTKVQNKEYLLNSGLRSENQFTDEIITNLKNIDIETHKIHELEKLRLKYKDNFLISNCDQLMKVISIMNSKKHGHELRQTIDMLKWRCMSTQLKEEEKK